MKKTPKIQTTTVAALTVTCLVDQLGFLKKSGYLEQVYLDFLWK